MGMKSNDGTASYMKRGTTEAPMEPQQHPKKAKNAKVPTGTKSLWSNPQCAALGALLQAPFSHGPFRVATPAPRLRTTLQLRRTSNAVHTGNTPAKHVRYCVLGQTNVGKFNQTVCFLVLSWKPLQMFHCKKGNKNPQPSLTWKPVSTERQQCLPPTGATVPLDVGWCEEKQVKVAELFQGLVSDATDGCKIRQ